MRNIFCRQDEAWLEIQLHSTAKDVEILGTTSSPTFGRRSEDSSATTALPAGQVKRRPISHDRKAESADGPDEQEWLMPGSSNEQVLAGQQSGYTTIQFHLVEAIKICIA